MLNSLAGYLPRQTMPCCRLSKSRHRNVHILTHANKMLINDAVKLAIKKLHRSQPLVGLAQMRIRLGQFGGAPAQRAFERALGRFSSDHVLQPGSWPSAWSHCAVSW